MAVTDFITWPDRSLAFVKACLKKFNELPAETAIKQCIAYSGELAEADYTILLSEENPDSFSIMFSSESGIENTNIIIDKRAFNFNHIIFIENLPFSLPGPLKIKTSVTLLIPLQTAGFSGILIYGYKEIPVDQKDLEEFGQLVQGICQERYRIQQISKSLENARERFIRLLDSIPDAVVLIEDNSERVWTNNKAKKLLSLSTEICNKEQVLIAIKDLSKKAENSNEVKSNIEEILPLNQEEIGNWTWYFKDPIPLLLNVSCTPINWSNSTGTILTFKDETYKLDSNLAQHQIKELSGLLASVLNSSLSGIMAFQSIRNKKDEIIDFECLIANETAKQITGKKEYDLIGQSLLTILPENLKEGLFKNYVKVVETGEPLNLEHFYIKEGEKIWSHTIAIKLKDGFVVTFSDITDRKNAEEKLRQNQSNLEALLENTDDFIWSISKDFIITAINSSFQEKVLHQTGYSLKVGEVFDLNIFPQKSIKIWKKLFSRVFKGEQFIEEIQIQILDKTYHYEYSFNPIFNEKGSVTHVTVFGRNITSRIKSEQIIRQQSQMLNSLLNNLPIIIFRIDSEGKIVESMGSALSKVDVKNKDFSEKIVAEFFPDLKKEINNLKNGKNLTFQSQTSLNGENHFFENYLFPDETLSGGAIGFSIDVTDLKQIEQEVKKAKDSADRANQAKSYFLANMSHDIRTPIHTILGFARAIKNKDISSSSSSEYLNYIISSGELLYKLVDDILELTKIEEGKLELKEEPFHFKETLLSNLHPYQFQANEKGLEFELEFDDSIPDYILGDAGKINRIVVNLIGNSLKFTRKGYIKVSFQCLSSDERSPTDQIIKVSVTDSGIGIPRENQTMIFNSFTQAEPSINRRYGGTGLGLAIVKELVELMGGDLGVISPVKKNPEVGGFGSTFWFTIPLKVVDSPQNIRGYDLQSNELNFNQNLKILLVEDNKINQQLVKVMLDKIGCKVTTVDNGKEAVEVFRTGIFDLILMDVQMPVMDGIEATREIRKNIDNSIPIIGLSAHIYRDDIEKCLESGMSDYLGKPFSEKDLQDKIQSWIPVSFNVSNSSSQVPNISSSKITDLTFLSNLYNGDQKAIVDMIREFILFQNQLLEQMEEAINNQEFKKIATLAHKMRSSIRTVGLESLYEPLVALENNAIEITDESKIKPSFDKVKQLCQQAMEELKEFL